MKSNDNAARAASTQRARRICRQFADWLRPFWTFRDDSRGDLEVYDWESQPNPETLAPRADRRRAGKASARPRRDAR